MKKVIAILMVCALSLSLLVGCGSGSASPTAAALSSTAGNTDTEKKTLKVAVVVAGALGDKGFNDSAKAGMDKAVADFGIEAQVIELPTSDKTKFEPTLMDLAESGKYDLITTAGNAMREVLEKVSVEFPEQKFYLYDASVNYKSGEFPNVYCNTFLQNEASFLGGVVAANMTSSSLPDMNADKTVGCVLMMDMAVINDFLVGFIEGVQYADPAVKVNSAYIGAVDAAKAKDMATAMYQQKSDIVYHVAASAGLGVIESAKEQNGYVVGVDQDQAMALLETDPEGADRILTSVLKRVDVAVYRVIEKMVNDPDSIPWGNSEALGMQDGCVGIAKTDVYKKLIPADVQAKVEDAEKKIASGEIKVSSAYGMEAEALTTLRNSVKP